MKSCAFSIGLLASVAMPLGSMVSAAEVEVMHWWTSGGEQAAVSVFADEFEALEGGHIWIDTAIAGGENSRAATMQRILGGDAPEAAQFNISRQFEDLIEADLLLDLTDIAEEQGWRDFIRPDQVLGVCEKDGRIYCVPVNIHSWQWAWASIPAFEKAGVPLPKNIDEFIDSAPALQEAGLTPFAIGGESWQHSGAFDVILLNSLGREKYEQIYRDKNVDVAGSDEVKAIFEKFRSLKAFTDPGSANRNWNDTTNLVLTHQAGLQIMGDWARGEFALAGKAPGVDYACIAGPSESPYLSTGGDIFLFPKQDDPDVEAAQLELAAMMVNPRVQALFNLAKGSLPIRDDVDLSLADECMKMGIELLKNPDTVVGDPINWISADTDGQRRDLFAEFWANDELSVDDAHARYVDMIATAD